MLLYGESYGRGASKLIGRDFYEVFFCAFREAMRGNGKNVLYIVRFLKKDQSDIHFFLYVGLLVFWK